MEGNDNKNLIDIERKLQVLFKYEQELAKEAKSASHRNDLIEDELQSLKQKINDMEHRVNVLYKGYKPAGVSYKDFTPQEILEMHKTMSLSKLAAYLHCSVGTIQNRLIQARKERRDS